MVEWKQYELGQICDYIRDRIQTVENYISTENMLPNKGGIYETITIPSGTVTVYRVLEQKIMSTANISIIF